MDKNKFYNHVSSWIKSYHNAEALERLRKFINNAQQPNDIKEVLHSLVDQKQASIKEQPYFCTVNDIRYLADDEGYPRVFTTRYSANGKLTELRITGYDAELVPGEVFYRIKLSQPAPMNN